jgi:hypothetical protein
MTEVYVDVTEKFFESCHHLKYSEIVALPEFSYLESMSAVELMDARLDSGLALLNLPKIESPSTLNESQVFAVLDMFLLHLGQWLEGQSLPHTFYSSVFLHSGHSEDPIIQATSKAALFLAENLHQLIQKTGCLREDDYAYSSLHFEMFPFEDFEAAILKAEKISSNLDVQARLKFIRGICLVISNIVKPDGLPGAETYLAFSSKNFLQIKPRENEDISSWYNKHICLSRIPHFLPNKIYQSEKYDISRSLDRIRLFLESIKYLISLQNLSDLDEIFEKISSLPSFDNLSRTLCEFLIFPISGGLKYFGRHPLSDLILKNMQKYGVDTSFLSLNEEFSYFLSRVEIVLKECILLKLKNKTRQQRILSKYLSDFNILVSEAHFLVEKIYGKNNAKQEKLLLFQWMFQRTTKAMIEFLRLGFELELYTDKDIGMVMFYFDYLFGVVINNLNSLLSYFNSKQCKKKKKKIDVKSFENDLKYFTGVQFLCRGIVRFFILLQKNGKNDEQIEAMRFSKRFRCFKNVQFPQLIEYSSYQGVKNFDFDPQEISTACKDCFDAARSTLSTLETSPIKSLLRISVKNLLSLSKAKKTDFKCKYSFEFQEDKVFPVFLIDN